MYYIRVSCMMLGLGIGLAATSDIAQFFGVGLMIGGVFGLFDQLWSVFGD